MTKRRGHGEGSIKQRADGLWEARVSLEGGKRKSLYGKTRKEVQDKLRAALRDLDAGLDLSADHHDRRPVPRQVARGSVKPRSRPRPMRGTSPLSASASTPRIGSEQLAKLTPLDLQSLYTELADAGLSPRSVHHTHRVLHRAFVQAVRWKLIARNPCDGAQGPRATRSEMKVWTPEQADAFLIATRKHPAARPLHAGPDHRDAAGRTARAEMGETST